MKGWLALLSATSPAARSKRLLPIYTWFVSAGMVIGIVGDVGIRCNSFALVSDL